MNKSSLIAIDLAKNTFQVCQLTTSSTVKENKSLPRSKLAAYIQQQSQSTIVMEACYSSHYWARTFQSMGHIVQLIPAQHVKPFVRGSKNDRNDALAIAEASLRPNIKFVPIKTIEQQDIQSLHRLRDRVVAQRTGLINQTRGILSEYGLVKPMGLKNFVQLLALASQPAERAVSALIKEQLHCISEEFYTLTERLDTLNQQLKDLSHRHPGCRLLLTLPGIGYINATALVSAIGNGAQFNHPREVSVWLGLTPREFSSGNSRHMAGITKRGNRYLRKQLIHGARAALFACKNKDDKLIQWARQLAQRRGVNKASVALASRIARLSWILLQRGEVYRPV